MLSPFQNFDLAVTPGNAGTYTVSVLKSPAGETKEEISWTPSEFSVDDFRQLLLGSVLRQQGSGDRRGRSDEQLEKSGKELFEAFFVGSVRSAFDESYGKALAADGGLRIRLRIDDPAVARLPWEFLYYTRRGDFLCLSAKTPIVRYASNPMSLKPMEATLPIRLLAMGASPGDTVTLDIGKEKDRLNQATASADERKSLEVHWIDGETVDDLQIALNNAAWHVFHFAGHARFNPATQSGSLILADGHGNSRELRAVDLARLIGDHASLRLVVLNACETARGSMTDVYSSVAAALVRANVPAVIAMQFEMTDSAAVALMSMFYSLVSAGWPVDAALAEARKSVSLQNQRTLDWGSPVLYMRSSDSYLFRLPSEPAQRTDLVGSIRDSVSEPGVSRKPVVDGDAQKQASGISANQVQPRISRATWNAFTKSLPDSCRTESSTDHTEIQSLEARAQFLRTSAMSAIRWLGDLIQHT